jgi:hypothetical protein|tara:strand:+ start:2086 stop:2409 length:324 start_codon:yes stop_codon:yes gene_type:complete
MKNSNTVGVVRITEDWGVLLDSNGNHQPTRFVVERPSRSDPSKVLPAGDIATGHFFPSMGLALKYMATSDILKEVLGKDLTIEEYCDIFMAKMAWLEGEIHAERYGK